MYTARLSELLYPLVSEFADSIGVATTDSAWVSLSTYHRAWLVVNVGDMGQASTLDVSIRQAQDNAGTGAAAIVGKAITQLTQAGGDGNDLVCIELQTEELDVDNGYEFVGVRVVVAGAAVELGWTLYGCSARFKPVPTTNWTEIVG